MTVSEETDQFTESHSCQRRAKAIFQSSGDISLVRWGTGVSGCLSRTGEQGPW